MQVVKLLHVERARGGTRLHFLVGGRALAALGAAAQHEAALNKARRLKHGVQRPRVLHTRRSDWARCALPQRGRQPCGRRSA